MLAKPVAISDNGRVKLIVSPAALRELALLPRQDRDNLLSKAETFAADPFAAHPWATTLRGMADRVRIRQGDWRGVMLLVRASETAVLERVAPSPKRSPIAWGPQYRREAYR